MTTLSNAQLAERLTTTVDGWQSFVEQQLAWLTDQTATVQITHPYTNESITAQTLWKVVTDYEDILGENPERVLQIEQYIQDFAGYELTLIGIQSQAETARDAAITAELEAEAARDTAVSYRDQAATSEANAQTAATAAETSETNAAGSALAAAGHKDAAAASALDADLSATSASSSATAAATSASEASTSATAAAASELLAADSETAAGASAASAASSESAAASSATAASTSETNATSSATAAATSASDANASAVAASTSASSAASSATAAELAATNAASSEATVEASKVAAETAATNAALSETNAESSATAASQSAAAALTSEQAAAISETNAGLSTADAQAAQIAAETAETNAASSASAALASETAAAQSATAAQASESAAALSESAAASSETNAGISESNAAASETNAAQSVLDAQAAQSGAEAAEVNAASSASASALSATAAETAESGAQTAETNAASSATAAATSASEAATSASSADTARIAAETAETNASASASAAATSETNAAASETKAADWAETPYDTEVEPGMYSALHWAIQAQLNSSGIGSTDDLAEGSTNLYWKEAPSDTKQYARQDGAWTELVIPEGYGTSDFATDFSAKSTDDLTEGAGNLYFTVARAIAAIQGDISWNAANWDTAFSWGDHSAAGYLTSFTETDPTVPAHVKAIASTDVSNWNLAYSWGDHASAGYLTSFTESDPTVPSHVKAIASTDISNWNLAYSWGNHASAGYLTSFTESDPTVPSHVKGISTGNISNWNTAYNWGNHASAGYQPASTAITTSNIGSQSVSYAANAGTLDGIDSSAFLRSNANDTASGKITFSGGINVTGTWNDAQGSEIVITGDSPQIGFNDTGSEDDFYIHVNSNNFYVLCDKGGVFGPWDSPHPLQLEGDTNVGYVFGNTIIHSGNIGSQSVNYANSAGSAGSAGSANSANVVPWSGVTGNPISTATGNYGSIKVTTTRGGWAGYAIYDDWVFMSNGSSQCGIYNDTDNKWAIECFRNNAVYLYYNGLTKFYTTASGVQIIGGVTAGDCVATSDRNLKDNIESLSPDYCLEVVSGLRPVSYNWKEDGREDNGLIAQEVAEVAPLMTNKEVTAVNYQKMVTYLIGAVQKQQEQISQLQSELDSLKKELS